MSTKDKIYVSYSHPVEDTTKLVEQLEAYCKDNASFEIVREKDQVKRRDSFKKYMQKIGRAWMVLVILSDEYFQSENCMFELLEINKNKGIEDKRIIFIGSDGYCCNNADTINEYVDYWQKESPVLFDKNEITKKFISDVCNVSYISHKKDENKFDQLSAEINTLIKEQRERERNYRRANLTAFRKQLIEDIKYHLENCDQLKRYIQPNIESFIPSSHQLSEIEIIKLLQTLIKATNKALRQPSIRNDDAAKGNICNTAEEVFKIFFLLAFNEQYFIDKKIDFNGENCSRYETSLRSRALVEGYLANEYNISANLVRNQQGETHGYGDLHEVVGVPNGWTEDQKRENYKAIHYELGAKGPFAMEQSCFDAMSESAKLQREAEIANFYYSIETKNVEHGSRAINDMQAEIPELPIIEYGVSADDDALIMKELTLDTMVHEFYKLITQHQPHANK